MSKSVPACRFSNQIILMICVDSLVGHTWSEFIWRAFMTCFGGEKDPNKVTECHC